MGRGGVAKAKTEAGENAGGEGKDLTSPPRWVDSEDAVESNEANEAMELWEVLCWRWVV